MSYKKYYHFLLLLMILCFSNQAWGTHIVGGEMNYRCLGNNQYEVSLTIFRDCDTGVPPFDNPAWIGIFNSGNRLVGTIQTRPRNNDTLPIFLPDTCLTVPNNVCIHTTTYVDTVNLPFIAGGYTLAYQRCCRNQDIQNIVNPNGTGATYSSYISEEALLGCNSSATFNSYPRIYICSGVPIAFDYSATDIDGDSLVYEMCTPQDGATQGNPAPQPPNAPPYQGVVWGNGFGVNNQLGGLDPLTIDPQTGLLTGTPAGLGVFLVGICIKEYRNGVLISTTRRDFQHVVGICDRYVTADLDTVPLVCNKNLRYQFVDQSTIISNFGTIEWTFDTLGTSTVSNPVFTFPDTGQYDITIVAGIGSPCLDTATLTVNPTIRAIQLVPAAPPPIICAGDEVWLSVTNIYEGYADTTVITWFPDSVILQGQGTDSVLVSVNETTQFFINGTNSFGCDFNTTVALNVQQVEADFTNAIQSCNTSLLVNFQNTTFSSPNTNSYQWTFDTLGRSTAISPGFVFPDTGTYTITLVAGANTSCPDTLVRDIYLPITGVNLLPPANRTVCQGDEIWIKVNNTLKDYSVSNYNWTPTAQVLQGQGTDSVLVLANQNTTLQVTATNSFGCQDVTQLNITVEDIQAAFDSTVARCNTSLTVNFGNNTTSTPTINNYQWDFDGLGVSNATNPIYTFPDTGFYDITLIAGAGQLCPDTLTQQLYLPLFGVDLTAIPDRTICAGDEVWVSVSDLLENYSDSITYNWSPASQILQGQGTDSILIIANTQITLEVTAVNNFTCRDTAASLIEVQIVEAAFDTIVGRCDSSFVVEFQNNSTTNLTVNNYDWDLAGLATSNNLNPSYTFPDTGTYQIDLIAGVGSLCPDTTQKNIRITNQKIDIDATDGEVICQGDTIQLTASNVFADYTSFTNFDWSPAQNIITGQGTDTVWAIVDSNITFNVQATNAYGCEDTTTAQGTFRYVWPVVHVSTQPDSIFVGQTAKLDASFDINYTYNWQQDTTLSDYFIHNPVAKPRTNTIYTLLTRNQFGCVDKDTIPVYIKPPICGEPIVFIPNAFTPDRDGHNDEWKIEGNNITEMNVAVYDRWGQKIFESNDQNIGWNGTFEGKELPPDVYGYYITLICDDGSRLFKKGNVTLLK